MSWDIGLVTTVDGNEIELVEPVNYTHNCNRMIREAGFVEWPYQIDGMDCPTFVDRLADAVHVMRKNPERFRAMDPENGWGSYDTLLPVLNGILDSFGRFPSGVVWCSA